MKKLLLHPLLLSLLLAMATPALALSEDESPPPPEEEEEGDASAQATEEAKRRARNALSKGAGLKPSPNLGAPTLGTAGDPDDSPATDTAVQPPLSGPRSNAVAQASKSKKPADDSSSEKAESGFKEPGTRKVVPEAPNATMFHVEYDNVEIKDVVRDFAERWGLNVLIDPKISGKVTIISPKLVSKSHAYRIFLAALDQQGYTIVEEGLDARGVPFLIRIIDSREAKAEPIRVYRGSTPNTAQLITRIIQLDNVSVDEISKVISKMISSVGDLTTYNPSNTLILTDSGNNIRRILDIIKELDISAPKQRLEVVQIEYAEAARVVEIIREIYGEDASGTKAAAPKNTRSNRNNRNKKSKAKKAPTSASTTSVGSEASFIGKMIADERTNSIIVLASDKSMIEIKDLVKQIDYQTDPSASSGIRVIYLSHAKAEEMSTTLNSLIQQSNQRANTNTRTPARNNANARSGRDAAGAGTNSGAAGSLGGNFQGEVRITHDVPTNSLVVTAGADDYRRLKRVIDALDIARKQVFVETVIMEVSDTERKDSGVSWHGGRPGDADNPAGINVVAGRGTESLNLASALLDGSLLGGAGLGIFGNAIDLALPGIEGGISIPTFGIVLRALQDDTSTNVLSAPNILTLDNEEATIEVGETVPFPTGGFASIPGAAGLGAGIPSVSFTREDVGIILRITPQVNESDWVTLDVYQEISEVKEGSATDSLASGGPTTTKRSAETHVSVRSNQTIVIGGLMQEVDTESESKVPILGDIPLIGALFRNKLKTKRKTNLLIFLTPHVIDGPEDLQEVYRIKMLQREEFMRRFYGKTREEQSKELSALLRFSMNLPEQPSVYRDRIPSPRAVDLTGPLDEETSEELLDMLDEAEEGEVLITPGGEYVPVDDEEIELKDPEDSTEPADGAEGDGSAPAEEGQ
ncbi:MAG: type II secretion system secretin GspD [Deltaproteobacteria bacterium]|nr:type II secretion system secretin GspD [Deltaproteobacteria bacterium]